MAKKEFQEEIKPKTWDCHTLTRAFLSFASITFVWYIIQAGRPTFNYFKKTIWVQCNLFSPIHNRQKQVSYINREEWSQGGLNREMGFLNTYLVLFLVMELTITDMALAKLPGAAGQQIQPALTLALALTSLVLLLFYIYLRKDGFNRSSESPNKRKKADTHPNGIPRIPLETRRLATDEALCHLFDCHTIPMAKSTLEQGRIIDANPSFCKLLGYPKKDLLGKTWVELDMIPAGENSNQQLVEHGWMESIAPVNKSGQVLNLSILSLIVHPEPDQSMEKKNWQVLTIVSDPAEGVCQSIAPQSYRKVSQ